jgi:hypothetical protein
MAETDQQCEERFARCNALIVRQREICNERRAPGMPVAQWWALTVEFGELQSEIDRLLGGAT